MNKNKIRDVFFDLDHTLWDFDRNSELTFKKIFDLNEVDVDVESFLFHYEPINLSYWKLYREEKIDKETLRFSRLNDAFLAIGKTMREEVINKLAKDYILYLTTHNHLLINTVNILSYLKKRYRLHIITNGFEEVQHKKLKKSKIEKYFTTVTNSEMVGVKKPNPRIFEYAINLANTSVEKSMMIGDSYEADILGAQYVGMDTIFFDPKSTLSINGIKKINNLIQLKDFL